jgi:hypothetical protein
MALSIFTVSTQERDTSELSGHCRPGTLTPLGFLSANQPLQVI